MNKTNFITIAVIAALLLGAFAVTYFVSLHPNDAPDSEAKKYLASDALVFTDLEGNPLTLDAYEGKVRVVNTWASWSPFSAEELKGLDELGAEFKDKNIVVIAVNRKEPKEQAVRFLRSLKNFDNIVFAIDTLDSYYASVGGFSMPETLVYDARGNKIFHKRGPMSKEEMVRETQKALDASL